MLKSQNQWLGSKPMICNQDLTAGLACELLYIEGVKYGEQL